MSKSRFHVSNFSGSITVQMNEPFALELFDLIQEQEKAKGEISPTLFALSEKITQQFFFMGKLTQSRTSAAEPVEAEAEAEAA